MPIYLKNPHSVLAVIEKRPQDIFEIRLPAKQGGGAWRTVRERAEKIGVRVFFGRGEQEAVRQGRSRGGDAEAAIKAHPGCDLAAFFADAAGLFLALDTVQDPQNLGAIFRTAAFFGVRGVLFTRDRSASMTGTVYDVASGGVEYVPFSVQTNLSRALDAAKDAGLWVLGTSEHAEKDLSAFSADRPWLLVLGNEERGMRRLTRDKCDELCRIPPRGGVGSLNVAAAAAICMYHFQKG